MKKIELLVVAILISMSVSFAQKIAVLDFKAGVGISQTDVDGLSSTFVTYFSPRGYQLVERAQINQVIEEQGFQQTSLTESQMVRLGQIMNLSKIVVGDVNIVGGSPNLDVRVIDVQSGEVTGRDGATFAWTNYRATMQQLAQKVAGQIGVVYGGSGQNGYSQSSGKSPSGKVETILGYLQVYPEDLGNFNGAPASVIAAINMQKLNGYNDWRLPTNEELSLMATSKEKLGMGSVTSYMSRENANSGGMKTVRLVRAVSLDNGILNGHEWVNLGLPSGTLWATCNVGASSSHGFGGYYAWGETETKDYYGDENYKFSYGPTRPWGDRTVRAVQYDGEVLAAIDDVATVKWGDGWHTPTNEEWEELMDNCTWTKVSNGYKIIGNNGNSIFLPNAGYKAFNQHITEYGGHYMSSTSKYVYYFKMDSSGEMGVSGANPRFGNPVRPVCSSSK